MRSGPAAGLVALLLLLAALTSTVGLDTPGWVTGSVCGAVLNVLLAVGMARTGTLRLSPADVVTLTRATLGCGVAALTADSFFGPPRGATLVTVASVALALDAVDGWVARHTRTTSRFGARFDGEADAFLILVLSVYVAPAIGAWVLVIGVARYAFAAAGWFMPWMRRRLPFRYWRKVVAAVQGIVLTVAAADILPNLLLVPALVVALVLLAESFGRDVWWLWRHRGAPRTEQGSASGSTGRVRAAMVPVTNAVAVLLVWFALVAPEQAYRLGPAALLRVPGEALVVAGLSLVLPPLARRVMAAVVGVALALLTVLKLLDMGFFEAFDRPFNLVTDRGYFGATVELLRDTAGPVGATLAVVTAGVVVVVLLVGMPLSVARLTGLVARHRDGSARVLGVAVLAWLVLSVAGLQAAPGLPVASMSAGRLAVQHVRAVDAAAADEERFETAVGVDRFRDTSGDQLLAGLRGKDVLLAFVESYGRVAVQGGAASAPVREVLVAGTDRLRESGYSTRSGFLTSPTFGGLSWLAHATLQSGLWVDNQRRYDRLFSGSRTTLSGAFGRAGWRTVAVVPSNKRKWPEGRAFYGFDKIYGKHSFGYSGPKFGFSGMPDQYALWGFQRTELAPRDRAPVMAEIDLASSHAPWVHVPRMVDWDALGDPAVFDPLHDPDESAQDYFGDPQLVIREYMQSVAYTLEALISFVERYGDDGLVLILLGDHQPAAVVSGHGASRDVPVTVIARDPAVIDAIASWGWRGGLRPGPRAPVWSMDLFRDRFLAAYGSGPVAR